MQYTHAQCPKYAQCMLKLTKPRGTPLQIVMSYHKFLCLGIDLVLLLEQALQY